jgi:hypothetical protein
MTNNYYPYTHTGYVYSYKDQPRTQAPLYTCLSFSNKPEFNCYQFTHTYYSTHVTTSIIMVS